MFPLTSIPKAWRRTLYAVLLAGGVALGVLKIFGVEHLGSLSVTVLLEVWAYLGIPTGATALSHLKEDVETTPLVQQSDHVDPVPADQPPADPSAPAAS